MADQTFQLEQRQGYWRGLFNAMASPCEILVDSDDQSIAETVTRIACQEALRIEQKFSRYRNDNIIYKINHSSGNPVTVDEETAALLDYAAQCYAMSDGMFDITSGVLRQVWKFDGSDNVPKKKQVRELLQYIGWPKILWQKPAISVPEGMEIDLGGIGKEYAVDRAARLIQQHEDSSFLVNFGGDLYVNKPRSDGSGWIIGVQNPGLPREKNVVAASKSSLQDYELFSGGIATSGDVFRYLVKDGVRYSHILDPRTGWPVKKAPRSITVAAGTCTEAGILATLAMLHGAHAKKFLKSQQVKTYWYVPS